MRLTSGTRLGPYEISAPIGAGGMGEVYRGRDTRLDRAVAIKVLPAEFSANTQIRARFEREAKTISSLNHPNVCTLYDVGCEDGTDFLVMELIEGESLAERIARGPMPLRDALRIAIDIADALEKAHRHGIVHRDLKPGNVMLTKSGSKLLDFGLSKPFGIAGPVSPDDDTRQLSARPLTAEGSIVGTFQYMSPEQVEGGDADARSDIFAFGATLYEMLTGKRAFAGATRASTIAQILERDPPPVSLLAPMTPASMERIVRACLAKVPEDRFQSAHDLLLDLRWLQEELSQPPLDRPAARSSPIRRALSWILIVALAIAVIALVATRTGPTPQRVMQASLNPPRGTHFIATGDFSGAIALSPSGRQVAFVAADDEGHRAVWVRPLDSGEARRIAGTENGAFPFWSPDEKSIGFFGDGLLKTIDVRGGPPLKICPAPDARGGSWNEHGEIVFAPSTRGPVSLVAATGGEARAVTRVDGARHSTHRWPLFLPGGRTFLYLASEHRDPSGASTAVWFASLDGKINQEVVKTLGNAAFVDGRLLFLRDATLFAQPFDAATGRLSGVAEPIARGVHLDPGTWRGVFDASTDGTLVFQPSTAVAGSRITLLSATGNKLADLGDVAVYGDVAVSRDGRRALATIGRSHVWMIDVATGAKTRLTYDSYDRTPRWSPDEREIWFSSSAAPDSKKTINRKLVDPSARPVVVASDPRADLYLGGITPDGKWIVVSRDAGPTVPPSILAYPTGGGAPRTIITSPNFSTAVFDGQLSPDGTLIAYSTVENAAYQVYMTTFADASARWQVTTNGGWIPRWSPDGKTLYFVTPQNVLAAVAVERGAAGVTFGPARSLMNLIVNPTSDSPYAVLPDGRVIVNGTEEQSEPFTIVTNWKAALGR